jgi:hypothetical protein
MAFGEGIHKKVLDFNQFNKAIEDMSARAYRRAVEATKRVAYRLQKKVVEATPIDTGRAAGNWGLSVGKPIEGYDDPPTAGWSKSEVRARTISKARSMLKGYKEASQTIYLANNVPYITILEYGSNVHAARAMLSTSMEEIVVELQQAGWLDTPDTED